MCRWSNLYFCFLTQVINNVILRSFFTNIHLSGTIVTIFMNVILTINENTVLYVGVTSNLVVRIHEHKTRVFPGSKTARYNAHKLFYHKFYDSIGLAIRMEKFITGKVRKYKIDLVNSINSSWDDLSLVANFNECD